MNHRASSNTANVATSLRCIVFFGLVVIPFATIHSQSVRPFADAHFAPPPAFAHDLGEFRSPLRFDNGEPVLTAKDWPRRRQEIVATWTRVVGAWPPLLTNPQHERLSQSDRETFRQERWRLQLSKEVFGEAWLLIPDSITTAATLRRPAVLVVYYEPETSVGLNPEQPHRDFGRLLARQGFVTLSIGTPGGDAWHPDIGQANCQPLAFHAYIAANCWQFLAQHPQVDRDRIGIVGHSYGGKWAMFAGAFWEPFAAIAVSDPGIVFDESRTNVNYWEPWYLGLAKDQPPRAPGIPSTTNPRTGAYKMLKEQGHDLHEVHALLAPRPFLVSGGSEDPLIRWQALNHLRAVNQLLGYDQRVAFTQRPDHSPTAQSNDEIVAFFLRFLQGNRTE